MNNISCDTTLGYLKKYCVSKLNITYECSTSSTIIIPTSCFIFLQNANLSQEEYSRNNPESSCIDDKLKIEVCSKYEPSTVSCQEKKDVCKEAVRITPKNNCTNIAVKYSLDLKKLQENYECNNTRGSNKSREVCVSDMCQYRYKIETNMTCDNITSIFKMKREEIEKYNSLKCGKEYLPIGVKLCVWPPTKDNFTVLPDISCIMSPKNPRNGWSIAKMARNSSMSIDEFQFLNPNIGNSTRFCAQTKSSVKCVQFANVKKYQTCQTIAYENVIPLEELKRINPTLRCDSLENTKEVCILTGYFQPTHCTMQTTLYKNDTCSTVLDRASLTVKIIEDLNPGINCSEPFERKLSICIQSFGMDTDDAHEQLAEALKNVSLELYTSFKHYINNMDDKVAKSKVSTVFGAAIRNQTTYGLIKEIYYNNTAFRKIVDSYDRMGSSNSSGDYYCEYIMKTNFSSTTKLCFCEGIELKMYCQSRAADELEESMKNVNKMENKNRVKRGCTINFLEGTKNEKGQTCRGGTCMVDLFPVPVSVGVTGEVCTPDISDLLDLLNGLKFDIDQLPDYITNIEKKIQEQVEKAGGIVEKVIESSAAVTFKLCLIGAEVMEKFGGSTCWNALKIEVAILAKRLTVSTELSLPILEAGAKVVFQLPGFDLSKVCKYDRFFCKDYCQDYKYYGSVGIKAKLFMFGSVSLYEKKWADPMESCSLKEYRIIIDYTRAAESFDITVTTMEEDGYRETEFDGSYVFRHAKKYAFSFKKTNVEHFLKIKRDHKTLAQFAISGKNLETLIGKKQDSITYFTFINSTVYYTSRQEGNGEKQIVTVNWPPSTK